MELSEHLNDPANSQYLLEKSQQVQLILCYLVRFDHTRIFVLSEKTDGQESYATNKIQILKEVIKDNIGYTDLAIAKKYDIGLVNEFVSIILDILLSSSKAIRIGGDDKSRELIKHILLMCKTEYNGRIFLA